MTLEKIIGRTHEKEKLQKILYSQKAEFVAVYGRRRVGKTYLIREYYAAQPYIFFQVTGIQKASMQTQLNEFTAEIARTFYGMGVELKPASTWLDAFAQLTHAIENQAKDKKVVLFLDELPWMASHKSKILQALDYYWNRFWVSMPNLKLIVCGSAASWVIRNILNSKGGLHNRVTLRLLIEPFSLAETEAFLKAQHIQYTPYQITQLYMCLGGIPFYLSLLEKGLSVSQNINQLCFTKKGALFDEYPNLFAALFKDAAVHRALIELMSQRRDGISREEIEKKTGYSGGRLSLKLAELEHAGFIGSFIPWGRLQRGRYYKITDEYTLFYLSWIAPHAANRLAGGLDDQFWQETSHTPAWIAWSGYAFENVCFKHADLLKKALNVPTGATATTWRYLPKQRDALDEGAQIDLVFDRNDGVVNLCEIKFSMQEFQIDKACAQNLKHKADVYQKITKTLKQIVLSMVTPFGVKQGIYRDELIHATATLQDLFKN